MTKNNLTETHPHIIKYWHPTKNNNLKLTDITAGSGKSVWWICEKGHEWEAQICHKAKHAGSSCPYCSKKKILIGFNDLATTNPHLSKQFHPTKNSPKTMKDIIDGSKQKIWWLGECGHEWERSPNAIARNNNINKCPYCTNKTLLSGFNDIATTHPEIAKEWHPTKNGNLKPTDVAKSSQKRVWWIGPCGHEWDATISNYINNHNCPYCANIKVLKGFNDLATTNPDLASEWHPTKNGQLTPYDIVKGHNNLIWWLGKCGHEWQAAPNNRQRGENCPYCNSKRVLVGYNDLATINPDLAAEWHPTKNKSLTPKDVMPFSTQKVWWLGKCGHEWCTQIYNRHQQKKCPLCNVPNKLFAKLKSKYNIQHVSDEYYEVISKQHRTSIILTYNQLQKMTI